jgi:hypothetical protein
MKNGNHIKRFKGDHWKVDKLSKGLKKLMVSTKKTTTTIKYRLTSSKNQDILVNLWGKRRGKTILLYNDKTTIHIINRTCKKEHFKTLHKSKTAKISNWLLSMMSKAVTYIKKKYINHLR